MKYHNLYFLKRKIFPKLQNNFRAVQKCLEERRSNNDYEEAHPAYAGYTPQTMVPFSVWAFFSGPGVRAFSS
jgi:hypothetical protein